MKLSRIFLLSRWALLCGVVLFLVGYSCRIIKQIKSAETIKGIRATLYVYAIIHEGAYPVSLQALADEINMQRSASTDFGKWSAFYYVGNLTTNDPPRMPIVISDPSAEGKSGVVLLLNGEVLYFQDLDSERIQTIVTKPWGYVRGDFADNQQLELFKKRIVIQAPCRIK